MFSKWKKWRGQRKIRKIEKYAMFFKKTNDIALRYGHDIDCSYSMDRKNWNYILERGIDFQVELEDAKIDFKDGNLVVEGQEKGTNKTQVIVFPTNEIRHHAMHLYPSLGVNDELELILNYKKSWLVVPLKKNNSVILHFNHG